MCVRVHVHVHVCEHACMSVKKLVTMHTSLSVAERYEAIYDFEGQEEGDLVFSAGDIIEVISKEAGDWWKGRLGTKQGIFPANYVTPTVQKQVWEVVCTYALCFWDCRKCPYLRGALY